MLKNLLRRKFPDLNPVQERTLAEASDRDRGPRHLLKVVMLLKGLQAYNGHAEQRDRNHQHLAAQQCNHDPELHQEGQQPGARECEQQADDAEACRAGIHAPLQAALFKQQECQADRDGHDEIRREPDLAGSERLDHRDRFERRQQPRLSEEFLYTVRTDNHGHDDQCPEKATPIGLGVEKVEHGIKKQHLLQELAEFLHAVIWISGEGNRKADPAHEHSKRQINWRPPKEMGPIRCAPKHQQEKQEDEAVPLHEEKTMKRKCNNINKEHTADYALQSGTNSRGAGSWKTVDDFISHPLSPPVVAIQSWRPLLPARYTG